MRLSVAFIAVLVAVPPGLIAASATRAHAQAQSWHATINAEGAVTDNVFAAPNDGSRQADLFFQVRPGFLYTRGSPRAIQELAAEAEIIHYVLNGKYPSVTGRGSWRSFYLPSPRTEVITGFGGGTGVLTALSTQAPADQTQVQLQPIGRVTLVQGDANEYLSYVVSREYRAYQSLFARFDQTNDHADERGTVDMPMDPTILTSAEAGFGVGAERTWVNDAIAFEVGGSVQRFQRNAPDGAFQGDRLDRQLAPRIRGQYRHDLSRRKSLAADAGIVMIIPYGTDPDHPDEVRKRGIFPVAGVTYALSEYWGRAGLQVRRDVTPSTFIAQNTVNNSATASAAIPLTQIDGSSRRAPHYVLLGTAALQRTQIIDPVSSKLLSSVTAGRLDLGILYTPRAGLSYGLRYELLIQTGDAQAEQPVTGFYRNTLYLTFGYRYPEKVVARVPKKRAGGAVRADRKDMQPVGAEPVIPDVTEQSDTGDAEEDR